MQQSEVLKSDESTECHYDTHYFCYQIRHCEIEMQKKQNWIGEKIIFMQLFELQFGSKFWTWQNYYEKFKKRGLLYYINQSFSTVNWYENRK